MKLYSPHTIVVILGWSLLFGTISWTIQSRVAADDRKQLLQAIQEHHAEFNYVELGNLRVTAYRSVPSQTDDSPGITSIGFRTNQLGVAVSRDFLGSGQLRYGDLLFIDGVGFRQVFDSMGPKARRQVDVWVPTYEEEQAFDRQFRHRKLRVLVIRHTPKGV